MGKKALITGVTGQDGSYLAELLLAQGYEVHGIVRRSSSLNRVRIDHLLDDVRLKGRFKLHYGDLNDTSSLITVLQRVKPQEIYNLAAQSHVKVSFDVPEYTAEVGALGALRILEAARDILPDTKFYQASTSELYGLPIQIPQNEQTPFVPRSPYGAAKLYAYWLTKIYREAYGQFVSNGILFNHESPRRGENFISRKVSLAVARRKLGDLAPLSIGNVYAKRDWGYAPDYVFGMWKMLQADKADDFVLATGRTATVKELINIAFACGGFELTWEGEGVSERAYDSSGELAVKVDETYFRPLEVEHLIGDASKAQRVLNWKAGTSLEQLIERMVRYDIDFCGSSVKQPVDTVIWPESYSFADASASQREFTL